MSSKPPTAKQLTYLRALAVRTGQTFAVPRTSHDASDEICRLKSAPVESKVARRIERAEIAGAIAAGPEDDARVTPSEVSGYGSSATWSRRS